MVIHGEVLAMAAMDEEMPKSPLKMPFEGVFIAVGKLLGGLVRDGVRGRRSRKIGEPVALRGYPKKDSTLGISGKCSRGVQRR